MSDIGAYGYKKYAHVSFEAQVTRGDVRRVLPRQASTTIKNHAIQHFEEYQEGLPHDHFGDRGHQLAAVAFNAMMEYYFWYVTDGPGKSKPPAQGSEWVAPGEKYDDF